MVFFRAPAEVRGGRSRKFRAPAAQLSFVSLSPFELSLPHLIGACAAQGVQDDASTRKRPLEAVFGPWEGFF